MHYLLRQKSYRIIWGGNYVFCGDNLAKFSRTEDLLGLSSYSQSHYNVSDIQRNKYSEKIKFIDENSNNWEEIDVWDKALKHFDWDKTCSVKYSDYLLNHTQKLAINLADYHIKSKFFSSGWVMALDPIPVLTETGGGTQMALDPGVAINSTEKLAGTWCGDLMQIVDELPEDYNLINCCFAEMNRRAGYCYSKFGVNENGYVLDDNNGNLFEVARLNLLGNREPSKYMKAERKWDIIKYIPVLAEAAQKYMEGRTEKAVSIAQNMLEDGMSVEIVSKYTSLSIQQIEDILKNLNK